MNLKERIRTLAAQDSTLQGYFGTSPFRWFDRQLAQGYAAQGTTARLMIVTTVDLYQQSGRNGTKWSRVQVDVLDRNPSRAKEAVKAVADWFGTVDFVTNSLLDSPAIPPKHAPNFVLSQREGLEAQMEPLVYVESLDLKIFHKEEE